MSYGSTTRRRKAAAQGVITRNKRGNRVIERRTVTWCQYGDTVMKPTDLWGGFPPSLELKPPCKNGDPCHEAAPRGAKTGTQGKKDAAARGKIPYDLALTVCLAAENDRRTPKEAS